MNLDHLERCAEQMTKAWGLVSPLDIVFYGVEYCYVETVIHEAAHAASLGLHFDDKTQRAVSDACHALEHDHSDRFAGLHAHAVLDEEAKAWGIEWEVLQRLKLDHTYCWGDVVTGAFEQGVDRARLDKFVDTKEASVAADQVMAWLDELTKKEHDEDTEG